MPHLHTRPGDHDFTASAYIVRTDTPEPTIMLHDHIHLHRWMQFGGHVELDESPWHCVLREVKEEAGYQPAQLQVLQPTVRIRELNHAVLMPQPCALLTHGYASGDHFHNDIAFAFIASTPPAIPVAAGESGVIRLFTQAELRALPDDTIAANIRDTALAVLTSFLHEWEPLPLSNWQS
jgi:8-oxo-dGTP pyrophosphatase MutT (NUDIX family)